MITRKIPDDVATKVESLVLAIFNPTDKSLVAKAFKRKDGERGFAPICKNRKNSDCNLGKVADACQNCEIKKYAVLTPKLIKRHVQGELRLGIYPIINKSETVMVIADFDNHSGDKKPEADVKKLWEYSKKHKIPIALFSSNSGTGYHVYIFFKKPIPARKARKLMLALIRLAGITKGTQSSFDDIFPKQDELDKGPGSLIALPYSGKAVTERGATLFLRRDTLEPWGKSLKGNIDAFQRKNKTLTESEVDDLLNTLEPTQEEEKPTAVPPTTPTANNNVPEGLANIVEQCAFLRHCRDDAKTLSEPEWYYMICALAHQHNGPALIHELSKDYLPYTHEETEQKIQHALKDCPAPITCTKIKEVWDCKKDCNVRCPVHLLTIPHNNNEKPKKVDTQAAELVEIGLRAELFSSPNGDCYARVRIKDHFEIWPVSDKGSHFRNYLLRQFHIERGHPPNTFAVASALGVIQAESQANGIIKEVHVRMAGDLTDSSEVYLDLCDEKWRVIKITSSGWSIIDNAPVYFRRPKGMLALPIPSEQGSIDELRQFIKIENENHFKLIIGFLIGAFHPMGPYTILEFVGEHGTAKSFATRVIRSLIDPNAAITRSIPKNDRNFAISASNSWIFALENLSGLAPWVSDALCRLTTGSGLASRGLYTDDEEKIFSFKRPAIINGINEVATRGDLISRLIVIDLKQITPEERLQEIEIKEGYEKAKPRILAALLNGVACALKNYKSTKFNRLPRMADFVVWVEAAGSAFGWKKGKFIELFLENQNASFKSQIETSPVANALIELGKKINKPKINTTAKKLLRRLNKLADDAIKKSGKWPQSAAALSNTLRRLAPALETVGITVKHLERTSSRRPIVVSFNNESSRDTEKIYDDNDGSDAIFTTFDKEKRKKNKKMKKLSSSLSYKKKLENGLDWFELTFDEDDTDDSPGL